MPQCVRPLARPEPDRTLSVPRGSWPVVGTVADEVQVQRQRRLQVVLEVGLALGVALLLEGLGPVTAKAAMRAAGYGPANFPPAGPPFSSLSAILR